MRAAAAAAPASPSAWAAAGSPPSPTGPSTALWLGTWAAWGPTRWVTTVPCVRCHRAQCKAEEAYGARPLGVLPPPAVQGRGCAGPGAQAPQSLGNNATDNVTRDGMQRPLARSDRPITLALRSCCRANSWHKSAHLRKHPRLRLSQGELGPEAAVRHAVPYTVPHVAPAAADQGHHVRAAQRPGRPAQPAGHREGDLEPQAHHHLHAAGERCTRLSWASLYKGCSPPNAAADRTAVHHAVYVPKAAGPGERQRQRATAACWACGMLPGAALADSWLCCWHARAPPLRACCWSAPRCTSGTPSSTRWCPPRTPRVRQGRVLHAKGLAYSAWQGCWVAGQHQVPRHRTLASTRRLPCRASAIAE